MIIRLLVPLLLIVALPASLLAGEKPSMVELFGRAHVMVVHFPVALLMVLALIEILRWRRKEGSMDQSVAIIAVIAAVSSILAIVQGWILAGPNEGNSEYCKILELHRWLGISTGVFACASAVVALRRQLGDSAGLTKLYRVLVIPGAILVSLTGHYGGVAVHGPDYLPIMPWEMLAAEKPKKVEPIAALPEKVEFWRDIDPIFNEACYECHNAKKQKGELRMDTRELFLKGGDDGPGFIVGNSKESSTVIRLHEKDETQRMPKKKPALSEHEIALIARWIDQGAVWPEKP
jgi:uncharacterized membrane protein